MLSFLPQNLNFFDLFCLVAAAVMGLWDLSRILILANRNEDYDFKPFIVPLMGEIVKFLLINCTIVFTEILVFLTIMQVSDYQWDSSFLYLWVKSVYRQNVWGDFYN